MKLNSFGETIRRIEAERLAEAEAAVANGWTEADHPSKCCPPDTTAQPKRTERPIEEVQRLHDKAQEKTRYWQGKAIRLQEELDRIDANTPKFDHGMLQLPLNYRRKGMSHGERTWRESKHATERANHYRHLTSKYREQLEKRQQ